MTEEAEQDHGIMQEARVGASQSGTGVGGMCFSKLSLPSRLPARALQCCCTHRSFLEGFHLQPI